MLRLRDEPDVASYVSTPNGHSQTFLLSVSGNSVSCPLRWGGGSNLIVPVIDGELGTASEANSSRAAIGSREPEIADFAVDLFDLGFFGPE